MTNRFTIFGAATLLTLGVGAALGAQSILRIELPEGPKVIDGTWQVEFEEALDEDVAIREPSLQLWGIFEYALFKEGRPGVLVGDGGWLFTDEEFELHPDHEANADTRIELITAVAKVLDEKGVKLIVALLPAKARVYPEKLGRYRFPDHLDSRYTDFRAALVYAGLYAPNLWGPMEDADAQVFLRTDTHWTPEGARIVAEAIAKDGRRLKVPGMGSATFERVEGERITHRGDLLDFVPLGPLRDTLGPAPDDVQLYTVNQVGGGEVGLFDEVSIPVTVTGSSYTDQASWGFVGALQVALGADVLEAADEGRGPFEPMLDYLADASFKESPPELVVWEIPERFVGHELTALEIAWLGRPQ